VGSVQLTRTSFKQHTVASRNNRNMNAILEARSDPELSPRQLRSVMAELVTALSRTLNGERPTMH
jgi:hypothetical protein